MPRKVLPALSVSVSLSVAAMLVCSTLAFGQAETILHNFIALPHGAQPQAGLVADSSGNLYGTTFDGGIYGLGTVFKLSPGSNGKWNETVLYSFSGADGASPAAPVIFDAAGNLYGTTASGGTVCVSIFCGSAGTVFKLSPNADGTWSETTLYSFGATADGVEPVAGLVFDSAGNLFGTTQRGGTNDWGTVFELSPSNGSWTETVLLRFTDEADGGTPMSNLAIDKAGNLYGTASIGGDIICQNYSYQPWGCGVVFELVRQSDGTFTETVLHNFEQFDGAFPVAGVIFDASGNLVGTTQNGPGANCGIGCGTVFQMAPGSSGWTLKTVYTFAGGGDGAAPLGNLVMGANGHFYGTTQSGGNASSCSYGCGTVFELTPTNFIWRERMIHNFSGTASMPYGNAGTNPVAGLVFDQFGNLYGAAPLGGPANSIASCTISTRCGGTVYKLSKNSSGGWSTNLLYTFLSSNDGIVADGGLIADGLGNLYGTTQSGGSHGHGSVFQLIPQSSGGYKERLIYSFLAGADGDYPIVGGLVFDASGNLFGTTYRGGVNAQCSSSLGCGTIFELNPAAGGKWTETVLHAFADADGIGVNAPLTIDSAGNLFGTTASNQNTAGTIFELSPSSGGWSFSVLYDFKSGNLSDPAGGLLLDSSGNLYGTAAGGQRGGGAVFELSPGTAGWTLTVLHNFFGGADGLYPSGLAFAKSGKLVGVAYEGGGGCYIGCGTVFTLTQVSGKWQKGNVYSFAGGTDAANPLGNLTLDSSGNLYGTTLGGGTGCPNSNGCGAVYKLSFSAGAWHESVVYSFGVNPHDVGWVGHLLWSASNILFGAGPGGDDGSGAVFQIDLNQPPQNSAPTQWQRPQRPQLRAPHDQLSASAQSAQGGN